LTLKQVGNWKDKLRRVADAALASTLPGGTSIASCLLRVDGYLYPHEAVYLYWLARTAPANGLVVEVGSFRGRSTLCLATGIRRRGLGTVCAVDPHVYETLSELRENIRYFGLEAQVEVMPGHSVHVAANWSRPIQAVFIDGDHALESVQADVAAWLPHLAPGGYLLLHDSTDLSGYEGPRQVASRLFRTGAMFENVGVIGAISWGRRRGGATSWRPPEHGRRTFDTLVRLGSIRGSRASDRRLHLSSDGGLAADWRPSSHVAGYAERSVELRGKGR